MAGKTNKPNKRLSGVQLNDEQLRILRHMLGIDVDDTPNPSEYRDYYCANRDDPVLCGMAGLGVVERYASDHHYDWYRTTGVGKAVARASQRAMLLPKPKRIYLRWLSISDVRPDLTFRDFLTQPEYAETRRTA